MQHLRTPSKTLYFLEWLTWLCSVEFLLKQWCFGIQAIQSMAEIGPKAIRKCVLTRRLQKNRLGGRFGQRNLRKEMHQQLVFLQSFSRFIFPTFSKFHLTFPTFPPNLQNADPQSTPNSPTRSPHLLPPMAERAPVGDVVPLHAMEFWELHRRLGECYRRDVEDGERQTPDDGRAETEDDGSWFGVLTPLGWVKDTRSRPVGGDWRNEHNT